MHAQEIILVIVLVLVAAAVEVRVSSLRSSSQVRTANACLVPTVRAYRRWALRRRVAHENAASAKINLSYLANTFLAAHVVIIPSRSGLLGGVWDKYV
eukprot:scaffold124424_cov44-Prasinocladus_malaysianus.AAC.1